MVFCVVKLFWSKNLEKKNQLENFFLRNTELKKNKNKKKQIKKQRGFDIFFDFRLLFL